MNPDVLGHHEWFDEYRRQTERDNVGLALQRVGVEAVDIEASDSQVQITFTADEWVKVRRLLIFGATVQAEDRII